MEEQQQCILFRSMVRIHKCPLSTFKRLIDLARPSTAHPSLSHATVVVHSTCLFFYCLLLHHADATWHGGNTCRGVCWAWCLFHFHRRAPSPITLPFFSSLFFLACCWGAHIFPRLVSCRPRSICQPPAAGPSPSFHHRFLRVI